MGVEDFKTQLWLGLRCANLLIVMQRSKKLSQWEGEGGTTKIWRKSLDLLLLIHNAWKKNAEDG
ncbi:hypothetical protein HAX54_048971, partial [Datura stramonium]|nr:hypothetical protein [Datura stramonium]